MKKVVVIECCPPPDCCDMRGYLTFSILYLLSKKSMYGSEIARELAKRRFEMPNPGTIYPALKAMQEDGLIKSEGKGAKKVYKLTRKGRDGLKDASRYFVQVYAEIIDDFRDGKI